MEMQREAESASPAAMEAAPAVADVKPEDAGDANCEGASGVVGAVPPALDASTGATGDVEEAEAESGGNEVAGDVKAEAAAARTCSLCSAKKPIAGGCANNACKKCCLAHSDDCPVHQKSKKNDLKAAMLENPPVPDPTKAKKAVLKHEFKESNFAYYQETVTIFCVRDFFGSKKLSQGILNDQTRSQRVSGSYLGKQPKRVKGVKSPELKAAIMDVLGKRKRPEGEENAAVARPVPIEAACG